MTVYLQKERNKKKRQKKFGQELLSSLSHSKNKRASNKVKQSLQTIV